MHATRRLSGAATSTAIRRRKINPNIANISIHSRRKFGFRRWKRKKERSSNNSNSENPKFCWNQVLLQWALGVYASTPLIASSNYRVNYSDAPRPLMPARGVAVAVEDENESASASKRVLSSWIFHPFSSSSNHPTGSERALRLLVVGDSLAAGVGMSKSGVPILPESIARALSKALGGRAVYWTCVGTPGVSAAQIVKDIDEIEPYDPHPKGRQLERIVKEFQNRRRRWQERRENDHATEGIADSENKSKKEPINAYVQWWKQMRQQDTFNPEAIVNTTRRVVYEWWMQSSIRNTRKIVGEDLSVIKDIVLQPLPKLDDQDDDYYYDYYRENLPVDDNSYKIEDGRHRNEKRLPLIHKGSLFRRPSVIPQAAAEYDIAVVLTGLNDVKEAFMPHMNTNDTPSAKRLESSLRQVLEALKDKMKGNMDLEGNGEGKTKPERPSKTSNETTKQSKHAIRHPLVVVPELPVAPLELFRLVPLCWFLVPIFRAMENNKRFLASCFPDNVVFVHQPDLRWWTDDEMGIGSIRENIKQERLLLRVTDSVRSGRERIEELMKKFYDSKEEELASKSSNSQNVFSEKNPSDFVSVDRMHPNDEGYELWGRHIAAAIIDHWKKEA
eukprot:CAMPEP_0116117694 /NCGR_PEP_ID=MMETSP0329-20121206/1707_1 /TAXON_ID=697910 /ORGANISM="Pseudo-nitzschia arenysensis, Strain B593" /LENGTH=615 /DNA_ID=CAMNT_0003611271 /DNA_START=57 /DNA_END=1901 /DNA_ORIENTATION=-